MHNQSLNFYHLKYHVSDIKSLIDKYDDINNFVFSYYSSGAGKALGLIAYVRLGTDCNAYTYAEESNILHHHHEHVLEVDGVAIMSNNFIPIEEMKTLIDYPNKNSGHLQFTPKLNDTAHVYYFVEPFLNDEPGKQGGIATTNPSPPATMTTI